MAALEDIGRMVVALELDLLSDVSDDWMPPASLYGCASEAVDRHPDAFTVVLSSAVLRLADRGLIDIGDVDSGRFVSRGFDAEQKVDFLVDFISRHPTQDSVRSVVDGSDFFWLDITTDGEALLAGGGQ